MRKNDILAGVCGLALGDALGVPFEFKSREVVQRYDLSRLYEYGTHNQPVGTWSDDTSMVLATLDAMCVNNGAIFGAMMDNFIKWVEKGEYTATGEAFDIGFTTYHAIMNYKQGEDMALCGGYDERDNGNGSLMRMLPVAYWIYSKRWLGISDSTVTMIGHFSSLTHAHNLSKECCVYYCYVAMYIMEYGKKYGLQRAIREAVEVVDKYYNGKEDYEPVLSKYTGTDNLLYLMDCNVDQIKSSGFVVDSLVASLWSLWNSTGFKSAVSTAVSLGEDTDTVGAITGSLAGLYYGWDNLPTDWMEDLKNKKLIFDIVDRFYERYK